MILMVKVVSWCQGWSSVMVCMHLMATSCWRKLLPPSQLVHWFIPFIQLVCWHVPSLIWYGWTNNTLMHSVRVDLQVCASGHAHQLAEVHVQPRLEFLVVFAFLSVLNGLNCMHVLRNMHAAESLAWNQQQCSSCLIYFSCWDGSLTCTSIVSFVSTCCRHYCFCSSCNSFVYLCSFMFLLSYCFSTCNSFFFPSFSFTRSSCDTITS